MELKKERKRMMNLYGHMDVLFQFKIKGREGVVNLFSRISIKLKTEYSLDQK